MGFGPTQSLGKLTFSTAEARLDPLGPDAPSPATRVERDAFVRVLTSAASSGLRGNVGEGVRSRTFGG